VLGALALALTLLALPASAATPAAKAPKGPKVTATIDYVIAG
jgi:hypothetical protein